MTSSGWQGLVTQSSAPKRRPRTRCATVEGPVHTTMPSSGQRVAETLEPGPGLRPEDREIDDQRAESHRDDRVGGHRAGEHAVLPAEAIQSLAQDLDEAAVAIQYGDTQRSACRGGGASVRCPPRLGADAFRHRAAEVYANRGACRRAARDKCHRMFTGGSLIRKKRPSSDARAPRVAGPLSRPAAAARSPRTRETGR